MKLSQKRPQSAKKSTTKNTNNKISNDHQTANGYDTYSPISPSFGAGSFTQNPGQSSIQNQYINIANKRPFSANITSNKSQNLRSQMKSLQVPAYSSHLSKSTKDLSVYNQRTANQNLLMNKELEVCRKEFLTANIMKQQADIRKNELQSRISEERQLVHQLKEIVKRLNKEITNCQSDKDRIRNETMVSEKMKQQLRDKIFKLKQESQLFYKRAQRNIFTQ
ncbi:UNKNOWN [Stylonychia lemnae]|uniref:Uncharacterized protein n=1 Tax=Stylonychia lemnae TaxID=5949 RepID=A0A078AM67_STYLE|nr:UNKNOWN [Stylonychia lemnae]|eukprot:CDW82981.1 UNKNOWN [Stylonychia lemnae]